MWDANLPHDFPLRLVHEHILIGSALIFIPSEAARPS
jgi:hypothetical protein